MNVLLLSLLLLLCVPLWAQSKGGSSDIFPADRLAELREELVYEVEEESEPVELSEPIDWDLHLDSLRSPLVLAIATALLLGLGLLIYRILGDLEVRRREGDSEEARGVAVTEIVEEELVERGVSVSMLERAEAAGQYDIAVRLLYITLLKSLQEAGLLRYRRDFSNRDYRQQLRDHPLHPDFVRLTQTYERYWYGKYPIDRLSYRLVYQDFRALTDRIAPPVTTESRRG